MRNFLRKYSRPLEFFQEFYISLWFLLGFTRILLLKLPLKFLYRGSFWSSTRNQNSFKNIFCCLPFTFLEELHLTCTQKFFVKFLRWCLWIFLLEVFHYYLLKSPQDYFRYSSRSSFWGWSLDFFRSFSGISSGVPSGILPRNHSGNHPSISSRALLGFLQDFFMLYLNSFFLYFCRSSFWNSDIEIF